MVTEFLPLVRQRRYYAMGAWTQHLLFCSVHTAGIGAFAYLGAKAPLRVRMAVWPLSLLFAALSGLAVWYHWLAAKDVAHEAF